TCLFACPLRRSRSDLSLPLFLHCSLHPRDLHSFPTHALPILKLATITFERLMCGAAQLFRMPLSVGHVTWNRAQTPRTERDRMRSEEHTSELQSRFDLVCRLLLARNNQPDKLVLDGAMCYVTL